MASTTARSSRIWKHTEFAKDLNLLDELFPGQTEQQLIEAKANLDVYLDLVWKQFVRMKQDGKYFDRPGATS